MVIIIMGSRDSGKVAVGTLLAEAIGCHFYNGDDFHPPENVAKLANDDPLTESDLKAWLSSLHHLVKKHIQQNCRAVVASQALNQAQQEALAAGLQGVEFVYLNGRNDSIWSRIKPQRIFFNRAAGKANPVMSAGEFVNGLTVNMVEEPPVIVERIVSALNIAGGTTIM